MRFLRRCFRIALLGAVLFYAGSLVGQRQALSDGLVRVHVVANSDSQEDQALKLQVRDALMAQVEAIAKKAGDPEALRAALGAKLTALEKTANEVLSLAGSPDRATVRLDQEAFEASEALPGGVYNALRVIIGEGQGHNWWGVVFPGGEEAAPVGAGFEESVPQYRFFLLDLLGKLQNALFGVFS